MALFTKKDLGLLLPDDTPGDPVSLRHTKTKDATAIYEPLKPKIDPSKKVTRYRAGQVPHFATGYEDDRGFVAPNSQVRAGAGVRQKPGRKRIEAQVIKVNKSQDDDSAVQSRRYKKALLSEDEEESSSGEYAAQALKDSSSDEDEEEFDRRRRLLRMKMMEKESKDENSTAAAIAATTGSTATRRERQSIAPQILKKGDQKPLSTDSSASSGESEWETDTDDSDAGEQLLKPVFIPKNARSTVQRQEELEAEEKRRSELELEKANERKSEARKLVAEEVRREQEGAQKEDSTDVEMPDDTDGLDPEQEYRDWQLREMRRIKRDRDKREQRMKEAEETLRRRNLTEEERRAEDEKLKKNAPKEKAKWKFMQKYYHKGAFYVDESSIQDKDDVRKRDASGATLEDNFNKEMLPSVMQVKNFGRAGRTKYTHLADQDTTQRDSLWYRKDSIREKYKSNISGMRDIDQSTKRRKKE